MAKKKEPKVVKPKYPAVLDTIPFAVNVGDTHADNQANNGYAKGERDMLKKVKVVLS